MLTAGGGKVGGWLKAVLGRMCVALAIALCLTQLPARPVGAQSPRDPPCGTYEYAYPYNTEQLIENHFIVLDCSREPLRGWYYGTSDDFDRGREGYLPGFFVAEMRGLTVSEARIHFTIQVAEEDYFTEPVPLVYRGAEEVPKEEFEQWGHGIRADPRQYQGLFVADSIVVMVEGRERVFSRVERE